MPMWLSVGPSSTMIVPMLLSTMVRMGDGSRFNPWPMLVMIGGSASLAVFWGIMNRNWRQKHTTEVEAKRQTIYRQYVARTEEELMSLVDQENARLNEQALSVTRCMELPSSSMHRLWERIATHPDFSTVRLGTGQVNMPITIELPDMRLSLVDDPLTEEPARLHQTYSQMSNAPITLRLRDYPMVGVLGSRRHPSLLQSMVLQLAATHSYHDLRIAVLTGEQNMSQWEWARWLPHAWATEDRDLRMVVWTPGAVDEVLSYLDGVLSVRAERVKDQAQSAEDAAEAPQPLPHFVVICTDPRILDNQPLVRKVIEQPLGMTLVLQASSTDRLPKECSLIIQGSDQQGAVYNDRGDVTGVVFEWPQLKDLKRFAYELAPIRVSDNTESTAIPSLVTFMDIYHARDTRDIDVWRFWNENHAWEGLRSTIGLRSGSQPFVLDISDKPQSHGPHGLVAGTTGSGKSVMLQTYILSLALNYHPNQVQFILIDYKGGGTANAFAGLPHVAGVIDNLQGQRSIQRALQSIQGEIKRREEAFKRLGIDHIDDYIRYYNDDPAEQPLAHLIVVVDEFAELKKEQPDFMRELVSAARVGRSVGMHLILATQKPSNSVDDEIWSNTRFRICLRVASRADSNDMLKRPDAAYLKGMGRCYVQVGNDEIFEQVQTSYSGAEYAPTALTAEELPKLLNDAGQPIRVRKKKSKQQSEQPAETQMDAVMKRIIEVARQHSVPNAHRLWLEELEAVQLLEKLLPGTFDGQHWPRADEDIVAAVGMLDDTRQQQHRPWTLNISARRNLMIVGPAASGKTTLLQTIALSLALRYSPDRVNLYIFSLTSNTLEGLRGLPHVGDVVLKNDPNEAVRLLQLIMRED